MKKLYISALLIKRLPAIFLFFFISFQLSAQTITNYTFAASSGTFTNITGGILPGSGGGTADEGYGNAIPIGFDFWYMGIKYTTIAASSNGWITLGADITNATPVNSLNTGGAPRPVLAPLWDDLDDVSTNNVTYVTTGTAGSRIFTLQYLTVKWSRTATAATISFQVKLYEGTGKIQFIYRPEAGTVAAASASIGITATATGSGNFLSLNGSGTSPTVSSTTETTTISANPASGQTYSFTPPVPTAPTSLTFSSVTATSMTLNWTDNSGTVEKGFVIYKSTDGVTYNFVSQTAANTASSAQSGLTASTTYYWKVYAVSEGGLSTALSGSQITSCISLNISQIPTTNLILDYKFTGNANDVTGGNNGTLQNSPALTADRFSIANSAYTFNGSSQYVSTANSYVNPTNFTTSIWFKTATASGGLLMGFGSAQTGSSGNHDRKIYMNNAGQVYFGVYNGATVTVNSALSYNDNTWHLATATLSGTTGMVLYIDGVQVASNATSTAENSTGYWRIGYDNLSGWPSTHTSEFFNGTLDDALVYHTALNSTQVAVLYNSADGAGNNGPVCAGSPLNLTATTISGAAYAWTGPNSFTSSSQNPTVTYTAAYAGVYTVQVTAGGCSATAYTKVTTAATSSTISYAGSPYCKNAGTAAVTFAGTTGGTYSSTAGLTISSTTGAVTLSTSTAGTYTVTYTIAGGCTASASITVTTLPAATISYAGTPFCKSLATGQAVTQTGTTGGTYTSTAGLTINASTGAITPSTSTAGTYTVTYTMIATGGCTLQTATTSVTITTLPAATISYSGSPFCKSIATAQSVTFTGTAGGSYTSTAGLTINASTGAVTPNTSTAGTYTVTYTMAAGGGCAAQTATANVIITTLPAATISYSGTPFCTSVGTAQSVTLTGTTGGTYTSTAGLTINASTGAITPSTSTAGNYTVTYTMAATGGCTVQTATASVTITTLPAATISYNGSPYCSSLGTAQAVTFSGTTGGNYTSTAGLTINASTGAVTPNTSTAGTYTVTYTMAAGGGCAAQTATANVIITTLPAATISYSGTPFCTSVGTAQPVTQTGTTGGTYSSLSALTINASTGAITPGTSTAGTYTVTYTMATTGGCSAQTATTSVTITALPAATIAYSGSPFCTSVGTAQSVTLTGTTGGVYSSTAGLIINSSTGAITPNTSTAGIYTVTYTMAAAGGCAAQTATASVPITTLPSATISYSGSPFCKSVATAQSVTQTGTTGGTYTSTAGLTINASTGAITPGTSTAGTYTVTYTMAATGGCSAQTATTFVTITAIPTATISYAGSPYCSDAGTASVTFTGSAGGTYSSTAGLTINSVTGAVTLGTSTAGTYTVTYTVAAAGGCTLYTANATITVTTAPSATISYAGSPYCSASGTASVARTGTTGGTYSSAAGLTINSVTGAVTLGTSTAGTYTVTYTVAAAGGCTLYTTNATITVTTAPSATISYAGSPYCNASATASVTRSGTAGGTYSSTAGLVINSTTGDITLATSTTGTYTVTYTIAASGGCIIYTTTATVQISAISNNLIDYINGTHGVICTTAGENSPATLTAPAGTVFINVAFASYGTPAGTCSAFTLGTCHASTSQAVAESYLLGNNTGSIPATNTVFGDPCVGTVKQFYVQAIYTQPICSGAAPGTITGTTPTGGNAVFTYLWEQSIASSSAGFSMAGGTSNAKDYTPGILTQTTWYRRTVISGGCSDVSKVIQVTVTALPAATISYAASPYCSNAGTATVTRTGTTTGTYSSTAGLTIDSGTGDIILASSTAGTYTVTYTMAAAGGCSVQTATASVTITTLPVATISYSGSPFCSSLGTAQPVTFSGTTGGVFSSTAGLTINASTGAVTPSTSTAGTYTVTYTMAATGGCAVQTATANVTITTVTAATISYSGSPFCISVGTAQPVTQTGTTGGVYSSLSALIINATTGEITPGTSTPGTYTVTYTIAATGGCSAQTATTSVTITALPAATISYSGSPFCTSVGTAQFVTLTGTTGGVYSSTAGLTINSSTGAITPNTSTAGTYTVTYTMAAAGGCAAQTATASVTITTLPVATISYPGSPFCSSVATAQTVTQTGTTGGTYSSAAGLTINASTGAITPNTSTAGTYTVTYTMAATGGCSAQTATASVTITALPAATISYSGSPYCANAGTASVTITGTAGGTYSSTAGLTINASTGVITTNTSAAGTYTVTYTMAAAGCSAQTATASVTITTLPSATISYSGSPFCKSVGTAQSVTQTGTTGGIYSSTAGLSIDVSTGAIIPGTSTAGTYTITYTMAAAGGCSEQTATASITITAIPAAIISYAGSPYMINAGTASVTFSGTAGGTYSSTAGLSLNAANGDVTLSTSTLGTYTVTYTVAPAGGCSVYTTTTSITVVISTKTFTGTGNFSDPLRWTGGTLPTSAENLIIDGACTVDNNAGTDNVAYGTLIIGTATGRTLNWIASGTNRLNITNVSAGAGASALNMTNGGTLIIRGTWASANLTFTAGAGTIELQSTITLPAAYATYKNLTVNGSGITVKEGVATTVNGNITITAGTLSTNNFNLSAKGNLTNNVSTTAFTAGTATVTFNGTTAQSIGGTFATTFTNLTIANTASTVTLNVNASITGNLSVTVSIFDLGAFTANRATAGGTLSLSNNTTLRIGGTNTFPTNYTTNTLVVASTVEYYGTNQTVAAKTYGNLTLSSASGAAVKTFSATAFAIVGNLTSTLGAGSSVTFTAASIITITGNVTIGASTTFNGGSFSHSVAGNWVNSGTFNGNTGTISFTGPGRGVSGSGTQNFNNLTVSASLFTFSNGSIGVSGNLATISSGSLTQASGGTLLMTGTAKTISGTGISLDNLTVSGSVSTATSFSLTGNLSVSGSFTASAGTITMSGSSKTISGAGTIGFAGLTASGSVTAAVNFSISSALTVSGSFFASAGTATFTGTSSLSGTANLFNTTINGTSLQLSSNSILGIANTLTITAGSLNVSSSIPNTVNFNGTVAQNINAISYYNLILSNGNTKTAAGAITTNNDITISTGTSFAASSYTHSVYGDWINNGTFIAATSTVQFLGSATAYLTGATTFNILTSNTSSASAELILNDNISAAIVNMTNGIITTGSDTITITNTRTGNGFIYGNIQRTHAFTTGVAYAFEGPDNTITFSAVSSVSSITVSVVEGSVSDFPFGGSISRVYNIAVPAGTYTATLRLHYEDDELNGSVESSMGLWNYNGSAWIAIGKTANNTTSNYVEQSGLTNISNRWTCSDNSNLVKWTGIVSTDWNTAGNWSVLQGSGSTPPSSSDIVDLGTATFTNQPTITSSVTVKNIIFGSAQAVTLTLGGGGSLTTVGDINGNWTSNATHTINVNNQSLTVNGSLDLSDGTNGQAINLNISSGTVTTLGSLAASGGANINFSGAGTLNIYNDFTYGSGTFTAGSGTVIYNGSENQDVAHINYNNLTINKTTGLASIDSVVNIAGNLLVSSGELDNNSTTTISGNVTISSGATLHNNYMLHVGGNWNNSGIYIGTGAHVVFNGSGTQTISATTFNNLEFNKPAGSLAVLTGDVTIKGDLLGRSGTLDIGTYFFNRLVVGGSATMLDSATLIIGADNAPNKFANYAMSPNSTVIFNGTATQHLLLPGMVYGNIIFRNAGNKILYTPTTVNGNLTIENGSAFDAGAQTITLNGNWINNGTFTPSTSTIVCTGIGKTISGVTTFKRFSLYGSYTILSDLTFDSLLNINSTGSLTSGASIQTTINGDIINSGVVNATGTTTITGNVEQHISLINAATTVLLRLIINGSVAPVINSTAAPQFGFITINNTAGITATTGVTVLYSLIVGPGASFNGDIYAHNVLGSVTNNGTITSSGIMNFIPATAATINLGSNFSSTGQVVFGGTGAITLANSTPITFHNVVVTNTNAAGITPASDWSAANNFAITAGAIFNAGNHTYSVGGNLSNAGTISTGTSTFIFNGTTKQTIAGMTFYNLQAANTGGGVGLLDATVNNNLSVTTGTLSIGNNTIPRTIAVNGNITIASGTTLNVDSTSDATHLLTVSGNIINSGTINLRPDANSLCNVTFNKVGMQTISGTGATTSFNNITVNKGVVDTNYLDVTATNFSAPNGFLTLNNGSFNLNNAAAVVTPFTNDISTGNFLIPATAGLWVNAGTINSAAMNWTVAGSVKVTGGIMNMGSGIDNVVIPKNTGNFLVTAGNLNLASRISNPGAAWSFGMQGGTMTVNTQGSTATGAAAFNMDATGSVFNMSAGTIIIKDAGGTAGQNLAYNNLSTTGTGFTGGTLQIGNILTTASQILGLISTRPIYNLTVNSANATAILQTPVLAVSNNVTVTLGTLNIDSLTLKIGGAISNSGTFTASRGTIEMNGTSAQTIPAAAFAGNAVKGLTINNNAGVTLGGAINLTDVLTVSNGSLASDGYLTLKSSATATARVGPITSIAATPISGNVIAERYVPGRRKYRLITSPVTTSTSSILTAGQEALSIWGHWQNSGINTTPLVGNFITGGSAADGFDPQTTNNSLFTYDDVNKRYVGYSTANGKNTKHTPLKAGIAYFMFVYGDRMNSISTSTPHNTVISSKGLLKTGNQVYTTSSAIPLSGVTGRFTLLGNPFASPIDWSTIVKTDLENTFWGWDPNLSSTGGYITVTTLGNVTLIAPFSGSTGLNQYIQSGQGFFVKTSGPSPVLTLREQDKVSDFNGNAFRVTRTLSDISLLAINLQYAGGTGKILADGVLVVFDSSFSKKAGAEDAVKMPNLAENMAILNDTTSLSLDARPMPKNNDTLYLNVARLTKPQYTLQIFAQQMASSGVQAYLHDRYLNTVQALSLTDTNRIVINVNAGIPASADINRFRIVFHSSVIALPVTYTSIKATKQNKDIRVDWEVAEESGIEKYEVERSADGIHFSKVGEVTARGNNSSESYHWLDATTLSGNNFYRVRAIELDGKFLVSKIVVVKMNAGNATFKVYPNPVKNYQVNIHSDEMKRGEYILVLFNPQGQQIIHRVMDHTGGAFNHIIHLSETSVSGIYFLQITGEKETYRQTILLE